MTTREPRPVALLLPGQGAQHPGMAVELYDREEVFTAAMDEFFAFLPDGGAVRSDWLTDSPRVSLDDATRAQPLLFAIGYALGRAVAAQGIHTSVLLGHSVGELAAAALAGVFGLADAAALMSARTEVMAHTPAGGMLAVAATPEEVLPHLCAHGNGLGVAARNAPKQTVVSGTEPSLSTVDLAMSRDGLFSRRVPAVQAFHCPAVASAARAWEVAFARVPLCPPSVPIVSTRTARRISDGEARSPEFWAGQLATTVLFWPALDALLAGGRFTLVEAGPGGTLSVLARRHPAVRRGDSEVVPLLPSRPEGSWKSWDAALSRLSGP
ncbi:acyltransferase domain-containing protein [Amycolatopsis minnesotensis]|uniref:Malonyl-CoA:ACP transacylase (MAT) domain-containing protein n=1 Tax=Amycolatopsis minnesotensis TaxID=337894 RepID=A0ABN2QJF6_9PSEU